MAEEQDYNQKWVAILDLTITNFDGVTIDLMPFFLTIDIQEDLFVPVASGNIKLIDSSNLYENLPIIGEESITIKYKDFNGDAVTRKFSVYSVSARERSTERGSVYVLDFCSPELLSNRNTKYSKSYKNKEVYKIFEDAINKTETEKTLNIENTVGIQSFIASNMYPFDVCSQMASRAISSKGSKGSYLFFEDFEKFNFISIESLIEADPIKYYVGDASLASSKGAMYIFTNYRFQEPVNNIKRKMSGAQGVEVKTLDLLNRKMVDNSYDHYDDKSYSKINRVNSSNPDLKTTSTKYKYKSKQGLTKLVVKGADENFNSMKNDVLGVRYNVFSSYMNGPKLHAEIPFNARLTIGMMIDVTIPQQDPLEESDVPEDDKYIQGKYLITALRHIITPDHAETIIELAKDTYNKVHG